MEAATGALPAHSPLGASSAERWMNCSGSVALIQLLRSSGQYEDDDPDYRRDGTQAHALAAYCMEHRISAGEAMLEPEFDALTIEMANAVQVFIDYAADLKGEHFVEARVHRPEFHPMFFGTLDFVAIERLDDAIEVIDYKHGAGVLVEAEGNVQIRYYAYGLIAEDRDEYPDSTRVKLTICQPRIEHPDGYVRSEVMTAGELRAWAHEVLRPGMERTISDKFLSVGEHCRFCPAKLVCPAMKNLMLEFVTDDVADEMSDARLADLYAKWEHVKMLGKAVADEVKKRMCEKGHELPGLKVVYAKVNRIWKDEAEAALKAQFGDRIYSEPKLLSPAQIESALGNEGKVAVATWAFKPQGGYTVALESDRRTAVKPETPEQRHAGILAYAQEAAQ